MKIACLQFAPEVGRVQENIQRADEILRSTAIPSDLTWLVLPELAFSGYNFQSLDEIKPFLEPTTSGISTQWAQQVAKHYNCHVTVGYAEVTIPDTNPEDSQTQYNSTVTVSPKGEILHNYRKSFLYYTDETWASEGPGSRSHKLSDASSPDSPFYAGQLGDLGKVTMGICMDINPYKFVSPWSDYEFSSLALSSQSQIVCISMAWLCHLTPTELMQEPSQPDIATVAYWVERFQPLVDARGDKPIFVILANRCGMEKGVCYAGSSTVLRIERGLVSLYETAGKSEETCLVVDLTERPKFQPGHVTQGVQSSFFVTPWVEGTSVKVAVEENALKGAAIGLLALSGADKSIGGGRSVEDIVGEISFGKSGTTSISRASLSDTNTAVIYSPKESTV